MADLTWVEMRSHVVEDFSTYTNAVKNIWINYKNFLKGETGYPSQGSSGVWTVVDSADGAGGYATSDLWTGPTKIVSDYEGNNHSWIRFSNATLGIECIFDICVGTPNGYQYHSGGSILFAQTFNVAGSATTRPKNPIREWGFAASGYNGFGSEYFVPTGTWPRACKTHGLLSERGDFWFFHTFDGVGYPYFGAGSAKLLDTKAGDNFPWVATMGGTGNFLNIWHWVPWSGANGGAGVGSVRGCAYNGVVMSTYSDNCLGLVVPILGVHTDQNYAQRLSPLWSLNADPVDGLYLTFPGIVGATHTLYASFKGRWPDLLLGNMAMPSNIPAPSKAAQERLKVGMSWLPFTGGLLSL